jgi:hypothetical protein
MCATLGSGSLLLRKSTRKWRHFRCGAPPELCKCMVGSGFVGHVEIVWIERRELWYNLLATWQVAVVIVRFVFSAVECMPFLCTDLDTEPWTFQELAHIASFMRTILHSTNILLVNCVVTVPCGHVVAVRLLRIKCAKVEWSVMKLCIRAY